MSDYPIVRPLVNLPREWASRVAFSATAGTLNFAALRQTMLGFAGWLVREAGVRPGDRVALCLPKGLEALQAIYAILAAGGAYVGLQFRGPPGRLGAIIASIEPRVLLTTPEMSRQIAAECGLPRMPPVLHIEEAPDGRGLETLLRSAVPLETTRPVAPDDLAAIVFTSGSTGEPKGVMRSHRSMVVNGRWHVKAENMSPHDVRLGAGGLHYIAQNLFFPAQAGCRNHLLSDQEIMFPELVAEIAERERATLWASTATALRLLIEQGDLGRRDLSSLRVVRSHGEAFSIDLLRAAMAAFPQADIKSAYGSTEAPNITSFDAPRPLSADMRTVPLGPVQPEYELLLCDEAGDEVPVGEVGEICAIGPCVTLGYWNDPILTAAKRLNGRPDSYRTGDLAFYGADGTLQFVGRKDQVVKLRGHRFDLGEIEAALKRHPAVRDAVAFARPIEEGDTGIWAAVESAAPAGLERALRQLCAERLPRFAWPTRITVLAELPRLPNAKVDRPQLQNQLAPGASPRVVARP